MLNFVDVRIVPQKSSGCIDISTNDRAYDVARSCLLSLKDESGLPVSLHSESVALALLSFQGNKNSSGPLVLTAGGNLPDRYENRFVLPVWQINVVGSHALNAMAEDIAVQIRQLGLTCKVFSIDEN